MAFLKLPERPEADYKQPPTGNHLAVCSQLIDLGTQQVEYEGVKKLKHQIRIVWELVVEMMGDGRPFTIGHTYTFSSHERSRLVKDLESWRGRPFTPEEYGSFMIASILGAGCLINCVKNEKGYVNAEAVTVLPKGTSPPQLSGESLCFDLGEFDQVAFDSLSEYWQSVVERSPEYRALQGEPERIDNLGVNVRDEDEVPF